MTEDGRTEIRSCPPEPAFHAWRKRLMTRARILCVVAVPTGLALGAPSVWGLGLLGVALSTVKLAGMHGD